MMDQAKEKQVFNPYMPCSEYVPDGEPHVFGDRVYVYGSHDLFGQKRFCSGDYICYSAPIDNLADWKYEGVIYKKTDDPSNPKGKRCLYAPDVVQGNDGRFYLYYAFDFKGIISVAVSAKPNGPFVYLGDVKDRKGHVIGTKIGDNFQFDPGVINDGGHIYLYSGFAFTMPKILRPVEALVNKCWRHFDGSYFMELDKDMLTVIKGPSRILKKRGQEKGEFKGHEFFEASSIRKIGDIYYFIYSSRNGHELCYATSRFPDREFKFRGTLISNADLGYNGNSRALNYYGNDHGSIEKIGESWYVFHHRQTNKYQYSRQDLAEKISLEPDGSFKQAEMTSQGLNGKPLRGEGSYPSYIVCDLLGPKGAFWYKPKNHPNRLPHDPYLTQDKDEIQYIANMTPGSKAGFKYFSCSEVKTVTIYARGNGQGSITVSDGLDKEPIGQVEVKLTSDYQPYKISVDLSGDKVGLFFGYKGEGHYDFLKFELSKQTFTV